MTFKKVPRVTRLLAAKIDPIITICESVGSIK